MEFEINEARLMTLKIDIWPEGASGGQRGPDGLGIAMTICPGAGMVQMASYWVEFETYEATLRTPKIDMWSEGD